MCNTCARARENDEAVSPASPLPAWLHPSDTQIQIHTVMQLLHFRAQAAAAVCQSNNNNNNKNHICRLAWNMPHNSVKCICKIRKTHTRSLVHAASCPAQHHQNFRLISSTINQKIKTKLNSNSANRLTRQIPHNFVTKLENLFFASYRYMCAVARRRATQTE